MPPTTDLRNSRNKFVFKTAPGIEPVLKFECPLKSRQCAYNKSGTQLQCKNRVVFGFDMCRVHTIKVKHVAIFKSTIPGTDMNGLFAYDETKKDKADSIFDENDIICNYTGDIINEAELNDRYGDYTGPYAHKEDDDSFIDAACQRGIGSFPNHTDVIAVRNAYFLHDGSNINIHASKPIFHGDEIFVNYNLSTDSETSRMLPGGPFFQLKDLAKGIGRNSTKWKVTFTNDTVKYVPFSYLSDGAKIVAYTLFKNKVPHNYGSPELYEIHNANVISETKPKSTRKAFHGGSNANAAAKANTKKIKYETKRKTKNLKLI